MMIAVWCGLLSIVHIWLALPFWRLFSRLLACFAGWFPADFSTLQSPHAATQGGDDVRGRVMAMYSIGILGSGLIGAPIAGTLADTVGVVGHVPDHRSHLRHHRRRDCLDLVEGRKSQELIHAI